MYIVTAETAQAYIDQQKQGTSMGGVSTGQPVTPSTGVAGEPPIVTIPEPQPEPSQPTTAATKVSGIKWLGEVTPQKWMNFYTRVVSRFVSGSGLKVTVQIEVRPSEGLSKTSVEDTKNALRELGLDDQINED
jgi:hypothetical protein